MYISRSLHLIELLGKAGCYQRRRRLAFSPSFLFFLFEPILPLDFSAIPHYLLFSCFPLLPSFLLLLSIFPSPAGCIHDLSVFIFLTRSILSRSFRGDAGCSSSSSFFFFFLHAGSLFREELVLLSVFLCLISPLSFQRKLENLRGRINSCIFEKLHVKSLLRGVSVHRA